MGLIPVEIGVVVIGLLPPAWEYRWGSLLPLRAVMGIIPGYGERMIPNGPGEPETMAVKQDVKRLRGRFQNHRT
ncbi:MAG: hypothetical protein BGO99_02575 [Nitrosospira sp. 56-18]|jgi:hypothetical protein|nr:hypothetical protein [Nitrosospira sp.]OJY07353.1 MAG: hypothetical protein BGO99_02575 [Nitrosospira sp. 56-18]